MVEIGAVQGRFQGLHLGHMEFLLEAKKRCQFLIIGITNYDIHSQYISDDAKLNRFRSASNPFTFFERMMMITASMVEAGIPRDQFTVVPFPIEAPERIPNFVPDEVTFFQTIYDQWGRQKVESLQKMGYRVEVMWERTDADRLTSGLYFPLFYHDFGHHSDAEFKTVLEQHALSQRLAILRAFHILSKQLLLLVCHACQKFLFVAGD